MAYTNVTNKIMAMAIRARISPVRKANRTSDDDLCVVGGRTVYVEH